MTSTDVVDSALSTLIECLQSEYRALLADDLEQLAGALERKRRLLAELSSQRLALLGATPDSRGTPAPWQQALARARDMNQRNALVLAPRWAAVRARLHFLQAAVKGDALYAADGSLGAGGFRAAYPQSA